MSSHDAIVGRSYAISTLLYGYMDACVAEKGMTHDQAAQAAQRQYNLSEDDMCVKTLTRNYQRMNKQRLEGMKSGK